MYRRRVRVRYRQVAYRHGPHTAHGMYVLYPLVGLALAGDPPAQAPATRDLPIATAAPASLLYLDGEDWTASGGGRAWPSGTCSFVANRDYNPGGSSAQVVVASSHYYMDQAACCRACGSTDGCAAAVFRGAPCSTSTKVCRGHCTFRTTQDLLLPVNATDNSTACIPNGVRPTPVATINASVPGDLITDLQNAGMIDDPLTDTNWKNTTWFNGDWAYSKTFPWPPPQQPLPTHAAMSGGEVLLIFEGIKMGAQISLNGHVLGNSTDQFCASSFLSGICSNPQATSSRWSFCARF
eukprot:COSAG02_NODE_13970_length_1325_cov_1.560359_2_plen_294_part_01